MIKKLKLLVMALSLSPVLMAQEVDSLARDMQSEQAFTFTEAQLSEDDDVTQNITVISSNRNVYASEVGYRFSPAGLNTALLTLSTQTCTSTVTQ